MRSELGEHGVTQQGDVVEVVEVEHLQEDPRGPDGCGVRFGPPPPRTIGGCGCWAGLGSAGLPSMVMCAPVKSKRSPSGVVQRPVMTASCSSSMSKRFPSGGKGMPYARCSASYQPVPSPSSTLPALMASTWATVTASGPARRNVADDTRVPSRMRSVSRARPASVIHASVGPGRPSPPIVR